MTSDLDVPPTRAQRQLVRRKPLYLGVVATAALVVTSVATWRTVSQDSSWLYWWAVAAVAWISLVAIGSIVSSNERYIRQYDGEAHGSAL